jgi:xanthine dehydrogenase YagS FAD-binding subunit
LDAGDEKDLRTELKKFGYIKAESVQDAISLINRYGRDAKLISGGTDLISRIKNRIETQLPKIVIDISNIGLDYIKYAEPDGLKIGGTTSNGKIVNDQTINQKYPALALAAGFIGTPQIQNAGTIAGDILQEVWCWYFRNNYACWRNGGNTCFGALGDNRFYHSIFGGRECYAVSAGDIPSALFAFDANVKIASTYGEKTMTMDQLMPGIGTVDGIVKENALGFNEILTEVHIPVLPPNTKSAFYKVRNRGSWDFGLASTAVVARFSGNTIENTRLVLGSVEVKPHRAIDAENFLTGKTLSEDTISMTADKAVEGATPLKNGTGNAFRIELAKGAVKKALRML